MGRAGDRQTNHESIRGPRHVQRRVAMKWLGTNNLGMLLLAIWLILMGLLPLLHIANMGQIVEVLAVGAGVLILLGR